MADLPHCPYCSFPVSGEAVTLWDGRAYCRKCVEQVSPELYSFANAGSPLSETVQRGDVRAWHYIAFIGPRYLVVVLLIFGLPGVLAVLADNANIWGLVFVLVFFGGGGMLFLTLQAFLGALAHRWRLPRTISLEQGELRIVTPKVNKTVKLADCKWYLGDPSYDQLSMFTGLRRGVVIQTPEEQFACGHTPEMLDHWRQFLTLARIPQNPPRGCLRLLAIIVVGMLVGVLIGTSIGYAVAMATKAPIWTFALGFMGVIEGAAVSLIYTTCTSEGVEAARKRINPLLLGLTFFAIGIQFGWMGGWAGAFLCGSLNALFGALVGWLCQRKIEAAERERDVIGLGLRPRRND